ncbi:hypothetical protein TCAL_16934 [Tigriopus californicus]|uniref:Uncharacterized protein n=1 Tax=Tigriopus californicus TaxID=6832 RepID=A0A553NPD4_TIGCA|nr:hypothetical protein TCAL_16934 [Tigriopus californicus]
MIQWLQRMRFRAASKDKAARRDDEAMLPDEGLSATALEYGLPPTEDGYGLSIRLAMFLIGFEHIKRSYSSRAMKA